MGFTKSKYCSLAGLALILILSNVGLAQTMIAHSGGISLSNSPVYAPFAGGGGSSATESNVGVPSPMTGTLSSMYVHVSAAPSAGSVIVVTLRDNNAPQALTCTIPSGQVSCSDLTHQAFPLAGDLLDWQVTAAGSVNPISNISIGVQFTPAPSVSGLVFLCQASSPVATKSIGPCLIPNPPAGTQWRKMIVMSYVSAYGSPGDTVGDQYNGDTTNSYRYECNTMAAGGTTFAAGTNIATSTNVIKAAPADSQLNRNIIEIINSSPDKAEKTVQILSLTGTGTAATNSAFDLCNGGYMSSVGVPITSITQVTFNANMGGFSGFSVFGIAW